MWADAVFEGCGVRGIGLVGALYAAEEKGYRWKNVAGTSAGSIIATLIAAGYKATEIYDILSTTNFGELTTPSWYQRIPYLGPMTRLWLNRGLYAGSSLEKWLEKLLLAKGVRTFADLSSGIGLTIIASDITRGKLLVLPADLKDYGIDPRKMSVARVVVMSCAIPFFFEPLKLMHHPTGITCYIVDGGVLSNFPVWLFDNDNPRWPTFGFRSYARSVSNHQITGLFSMLSSLFYTMMEAHDRRHIQEQDQVRTIQVASNVNHTNFSISKEVTEQLFQTGKKAAEEFFKTWTFGNYLAVRGISRVSYKIKAR